MQSRSTEWWDRYFLQLAKHVSSASKDPSCQVGAIIVNDKRQVVGTGYNGFPRRIADLDERLNDREQKLKFIIHAEMNALLDAGRDAQDCTIYVYPTFALPPICENCCKHAIQAGVRGIVGYNGDPNNPRIGRWKDSIAISAEMWKEAGNWIRSYDE
jgi:dCMP deaminase